jgi:hypothetical protein
MPTLSMSALEVKADVTDPRSQYLLIPIQTSAWVRKANLIAENMTESSGLRFGNRLKQGLMSLTRGCIVHSFAAVPWR